MKVGELKEILKNVPDDFGIISAFDSTSLEDVEVEVDDEIVYLYMEDI